MLRIGHRGAAALAPENTIQSLRLAQELGCDLVELDVLVVEETLVLAHSAAELPSERATLDEALAVLAPAGTGIQVDLKTPGVEAAVADALRRHGVLDRALVSSFHPGSLRALKGLAGARLDRALRGAGAAAGRARRGRCHRRRSQDPPRLDFFS